MRLTMVLGLVFVVVGVAFKLGAVPFHMWVPDVYEGAPTPVTLFIATAPKIAAFGMLMRALVDGLGGLVDDWSQMLAVLAVLSMAIGNVIAIAQTNIKRMLAYSAIAHVGFVFVGMASGTSGRIRGLDVLRPDLRPDGARRIRDGHLARSGPATRRTGWTTSGV